MRFQDSVACMVWLPVASSSQPGARLRGCHSRRCPAQLAPAHRSTVVRWLCSRTCTTMPFCDLPLCQLIALLVPPYVVQFWEEKAKSYGPIASGALFGAGWWFWVDAVVCTSHPIPFDQYLPGIIATLALVMTNCIRRDDLQDYDPFDDGGFCRSRFWLFLSYVVSFASVVGAVWALMQHYAMNPAAGGEVWPGVAGVFQVACILGSGLLFFVSRTPADSAHSGYEVF